MSAPSTGTSHINDRAVCRAAGFYCSGASQGLWNQGGHTTFITSHDPPPARHPVGLFSQVPGVKFTATDRMIDRGITGERAWAGFHVGGPGRDVTVWWGCARQIWAWQGSGCLVQEQERNYRKWDFNARSFKICLDQNYCKGFIRTARCSCSEHPERKFSTSHLLEAGPVFLLINYRTTR